MPVSGHGATKEPELTPSISPVHIDLWVTKGSLPDDDVANLGGLVDVAEKNTDDPDAALAMLAILVDRRIATRRHRRAAVEDDSAEGRGQPPATMQAPGGEMASQITTPPSARRPFVGYDREREAYRLAKAGLLSRVEGQYVVLVGDELIGPFESHEAAERAGYARFGRGPLFIKQVLAEERPIEVSRLVAQ